MNVLTPPAPSRPPRRPGLRGGLAASWFAEPAAHVRQLWAAEGATLVTGFVQLAVLTRILGIEGLGTASLVVAVPTLAFSLLDPQSQSAVTRSLARQHARSDGSRAAAAIRLGYIADGLLALGGTLLLALLSPLIAHHLLRGDVPAALVAVAVLGASSASSVLTSRAVLGSIDAFRTIRRVAVYVAVGRCAAVCAAAALWGIAGFVLAVAGTQVLEAVAYAVVATGAHRRAVGVGVRDVRTDVLGAERRELVRFMGYTNVTTFLGALYKDADLVIVGVLAGPLDAGRLKIARTVALGIGRAVGPLQAVAVTRLYRTAEDGGTAALRRQCRRYLLRVGLPVMLAGLLALPLVPGALTAVTGTADSGALAATLWLTGAALVSLAFFWVVPSLVAANRPRTLLVLSGTTSILCFLGYLAVAGPFGATGVAVVRALGAGLVANLVFLAILPRILPDPAASLEGAGV